LFYDDWTSSVQHVQHTVISFLDTYTADTYRHTYGDTHRQTIILSLALKLSCSAQMIDTVGCVTETSFATTDTLHSHHSSKHEFQLRSVIHEYNKLELEFQLRSVDTFGMSSTLNRLRASFSMMHSRSEVV